MLDIFYVEFDNRHRNPASGPRIHFIVLGYFPGRDKYESVIK